MAVPYKAEMTESEVLSLLKHYSRIIHWCVLKKYIQPTILLLIYHVFFKGFNRVIKFKSVVVFKGFVRIAGFDNRFDILYKFIPAVLVNKIIHYTGVLGINKTDSVFYIKFGLFFPFCMKILRSYKVAVTDILIGFLF